MDIEVIYEPNFQDYFRVVRRVAIKRFRVFLVVLIAAPLALVVFTVTEPQRPDRPAPSGSREVWSILLIPAGLAVVMYAGAYYSARRHWTGAPEIRETRRINISETGLDVKGDTFSGQNGWTNIAGGEKINGLYVLRTRGRAYYLFPEQSFASDSQLQEFLKIARRKLGRSFRG